MVTIKIPVSILGKCEAIQIKYRHFLSSFLLLKDQNILKSSQVKINKQVCAVLTRRFCKFSLEEFKAKKRKILIFRSHCREENNISYICSIGQIHHKSIYSHAPSTGGWQSIFQSLTEIFINGHSFEISCFFGSNLA